MPKVSLRAHALVALMLSMLVALAYASVVGLSFLADDWAVIRLATITQDGSWWFVILNDLSSPLFDRISMYRPTYSLSFRLDYLLYGTAPAGYHLTNLALHAVCSFFVYLLALELTPGERKREIAVTAGAIFALYPVHPEAVTWIAGRVDPICAAFYLPALLFFVRWLRLGGGLYLALSLASFALALLSKEMATALPGLLFLFAVYEKSLKEALMRVLPFAITLGIYLIFRAYVLGGTGSYGVADWGLDFVKVLQGFLYRTSHMFVPINLGLLPGSWRDFITVAFLSLPILVVAVLAVAYYRGWVKDRFPILLFVLYAVSLVPVLKGLRPDPVLVSSRWSYIPSALLSILIAYVLWTWLAARPRSAALAAAVVCAVFFAVLLANNGPWLKAEELTQRYLRAGEEPDMPVKYKGAYVFSSRITWISANSPPFEETRRPGSPERRP